jgi:hypothetical protein
MNVAVLGSARRRDPKSSRASVGAGIMIAHNSFHGSERATLPAVALSDDAHAAKGIEGSDRRQGQPVSDEAPHAIPKDAALLAAPRQRAMPGPPYWEPKDPRVTPHDRGRCGSLAHFRVNRLFHSLHFAGFNQHTRRNTMENKPSSKTDSRRGAARALVFAPTVYRLRRFAARLTLIAGLWVLYPLVGDATTLFKPVGRPPEVFAFSGVTMTQPLTSNPYALNSPKVYFIFLGPNWIQNGKPSPAVSSMTADAKAILNSQYLSGLKQYGSDGIATYGDFTIDTTFDPSINPTFNPVCVETDKILSDPNFSSWNPPPGGDARTSPIYVVVRYGGGPGGSNDFGPNNKGCSRAVNVIDDLIPSADQVDSFSFVFSHEIVERMSSGIAGLYEVYPDAGGQIADGEPEGNNLYASRLNGSSGPEVTSYWSVVDQAFIVPDGNLQRVLLVPIWNSGNWTGKCLSLQQGNLYEISPPDQKILIDVQVQSFAINVQGGVAQVLDVTANGQVKQYSGSGTNWTSLTGPNFIASSLVTTSYLVTVGKNSSTSFLTNGNAYMLASNNRGPNQVWQYSGSGQNWTAITATNPSVTSLAAARGALYVLTNNTVWQNNGSGNSWTPVTATNTYVYAIAAVESGLYMQASEGGGRIQVWHYSGSGNQWEAVTTNTSVASIAVAGDVLCMIAVRDGDVSRVWQYSLVSTFGIFASDNNWIPLTGTNLKPSQIVVQDGIELYMMAANNGGNEQVWQYKGTPNDWVALTPANTNVFSISVGTNNRLYMIATDGEGAYVNWIYNGTPNSWTDLGNVSNPAPGGAGSPLAGLFDTIHGTPDVFDVGADQHVHILYFDGNWHKGDVTADAGAPNAAAGSPLADLLDTFYSTPDVFYLGTDQRVHILSFDGNWHTADVTAAAGAANAAVGSPLADLFDTIHATPDVFYLGVDHHVHILYFNGSWHTADVTAAAGGANAAVGSRLTGLFDTIHGTPDVFYQGADEHVHILYFNGSWHTADVTAAAGAANAAVGSPLADLFDTIHATSDVFYLGVDHHVHILYFNGSWHTADVTAAAGAANAAVGSPLVDLLDTVNSTPDVFYLGADQHLHILYFNGSWHTGDVTAAAGAPNAATGSPLADLLDPIHRTPDVFYLGADQHVHILYFNGSWHTSDVTASSH